MKFLALPAIVALFALVPRPASAPPRPVTNPNCGEASWTITDQKHQSTIFNGMADCTTVQPNPMLMSNMGPEDARLSLVIRFDRSGTLTCSNGGPVSVSLSGIKAPMDDSSYTAGQGNPPPPGSSCEFSIADFPRQAGRLRGSLKSVLGRCVKVGGCSKPTDWDMISMEGSFEAYFSGPGDDN